MQARHEYKHSLNYLDYQLLRTRLSAVLPHDANVNQQGEYIVRSLYFDTPHDKALREKIDGVDRREKFRIRNYNYDTSYIKLEKKSKARSLCYKQSVRISAAEVAALIQGNLDWMPNDNRPLIVELYSKMAAQRLQPKSIVEYIREPFTCAAGNVRITLDRAIKTALSATDFLNAHLPTIAAGNEMVLLEVKYDAFIPQHLVDLLALPARRAGACSKYALSRIYG